MSWQNRITRHGELAPAEIVANPRNWRAHPDAQRAALGGVLDEVGWVDEVIVNERTGLLVDGHLRVALAIERGEQTVPVRFVDLSEEEEGIVLASFDPISALAGKQADRLQALLQSIDTSSTAMRGLVETIANQHKIQLGDVHAGAPPGPPPETTIKRGDVIKLGHHRLMCGDAGSADDLATLLDGDMVHLVHTDPPYNVRVEPRSNNAIAAGISSFPPGMGAIEASDKQGMHHQGFDLARDKTKSTPTGAMRAKDRPLINDFLRADDFYALLLSWFENIGRALIPGRAFYIWGGFSNIENFPIAAKATGLYFSQAIIWVKGHPVLTRKDFMGDHEWCFYGWKEGAAHYFAPGINNATDVWQVKKINPQAMIHLTEKPVELAARAIKYSSQPGENVLDLFGGSGSTLIAAHALDRRAYLMELDPLYCQVIVDRFNKEWGPGSEGYHGEGQ